MDKLTLRSADHPTIRKQSPNKGCKRKSYQKSISSGHVESHMSWRVSELAAASARHADEQKHERLPLAHLPAHNHPRLIWPAVPHINLPFINSEPANNRYCSSKDIVDVNILNRLFKEIIIPFLLFHAIPNALNRSKSITHYVIYSKKKFRNETLHGHGHI